MAVHKRIFHLSVAACLLVVFAIIRQHGLTNIPTTRWHQGLNWANASLTMPSYERSKWSGLGRWKPVYSSSEGQRNTAQFKEKEEDYTRTLVIPRMKDEDISWIARELPDLNVTVYVANDPSTLLHSPKNKGHEVMVYLTYIIDHYDNLPDVIMFMHAHRWAHHNNELLGYDAPQMIKRLSNSHVIQQGYVNLRCHWSPGCPEWLHPHKNNEDELIEKQEEAVLVESWEELFPSEPLPPTLAQPCCAQFALSRKRIHSLPLSRFIFFRDWILQTPLSDYVSGRIWEYSWQYLFSSQGVSCPPEHLCYCNAFRVCFGGASELNSYKDLQRTKLEYEKQINEVQNNNGSNLMSPEPDSYAYLHKQVDALNKELASRKKKALDRGEGLQFGKHVR